MCTYTEGLLSQLYKGAEEDVVQLYDLSILPEKRTAGDHISACSPVSSLMNKGRRESLFSLGTLLYRVAHRMSLSKVPGNCHSYFAYVQFFFLKMYLCTALLIVKGLICLQVPSNRAKCAKFFRKCLDFLSKQDHLVIIYHLTALQICYFLGEKFVSRFILSSFRL